MLGILSEQNRVTSVISWSFYSNGWGRIRRHNKQIVYKIYDDKCYEGEQRIGMGAGIGIGCNRKLSGKKVTLEERPQEDDRESDVIS